MHNIGVNRLISYFCSTISILFIKRYGNIYQLIQKKYWREFFKKRTVKTLKELGIANPTDEDVLLYNLDAEVAKKFFAAK